MSDLGIIVGRGTERLDSAGWDAVVDAAGTPFQSRRFLLPWWEEASARHPASRLLTVEVIDGGGGAGGASGPSDASGDSGDSDASGTSGAESGARTVGVCAFELRDGQLAFAGGEDLVDYMGPVAAPDRAAEVAEAVAGWIFDEAEWRTARFGGLVPTEAAAAAFIGAVRGRTPAAVVEPYDQAPGIDAAPDGYLALLNSKRRLDVLRKRNRLTEEFGEVHLEPATPETAPEVLERLLAWKAAAGEATSAFVAEYGGVVRALLSGLAPAGVGQVVELRAGTRPLASAIVLHHRSTTYLYNMAYDPTLISEAGVGLAPGVVLVSHLAEQALDAGRRFDFLKGAQDYKRRLGGVARDLVAVIVER
jgi:CelD/BcsL family acetyltransferase involved in cellulose biosynthesis